ncbi:SGNH/GDSL hydrolase family protein [Actinoplanes friuliensis]|uniref:Putative GDSL-like lipase/acylhydrolase n=1 Tax=Actinoplanes friuliensis DSM 7358 TaxID=1246995 RepID=U5W766_9ACTN|nr:SGNH/GDSL hydrolase family protein [Actinoplanes friuliensis]AGZ43830.1 putative GDSL-like lipase/acylhydrolase [Actinoplanes friuliensis DSM 7358]
MPRRWQLVALVLLAALALACEGEGTAAPDPTGKPKSNRPASMAALGDSITAGYGTCFTLVACYRNSWSTGSSAAVDSHYRRIRDDNSKIKGNADNYAVPGARARGLSAQAKRAVDAKVQYVTVLIGANDACTDTAAGMTSVATFREQIDAALTRLKKGLPKARVLVVSIPDLYRLWQLGHENTNAVRAWNRGVCPSLLARPTSTAQADEDRRRQVDKRVDAYNDELADACEDYGKRCRWDGGSAHRVRFSLDLVNERDYFHPDIEGQNKLADVTYPGRFTW